MLYYQVTKYSHSKAIVLEVVTYFFNIEVIRTARLIN